MSFSLYLTGVVIVIAGVAWALMVAGISLQYVLIACVISLGIGVLTGVAYTRTKDRSKDPSP